MHTVLRSASKTVTIGADQPFCVIGERINPWFHATLANRAQFLPLMLTGNIGTPGAGCYTWAGNYKAALFQGSPQTGPGFKGWVAEDPFEMTLDPAAHDVVREIEQFKDAFERDH